MMLNSISINEAKRNFQKVLDLADKYEETHIVEGDDDDDYPSYIVLPFETYLDLEETVEWKSVEKKAFEAFVG